jgi:hypothetical protein
VFEEEWAASRPSDVGSHVTQKKKKKKQRNKIRIELYTKHGIVLLYGHSGDQCKVRA